MVVATYRGRILPLEQAADPPWPKIESYFWPHIVKADDCWIHKGRQNRDGYVSLVIWFQGHGWRIFAHRLSWWFHYGPIPPNMQVLHHCDTPACVNPKHLFLGTNLDNISDKVSKGRQSKGAAHAATLPDQKGENNRRAVLDEQAVEEIRRTPVVPGLTKQLAIKFGVTTSAIKNARSGGSWKNVTSVPPRSVGHERYEGIKLKREDIPEIRMLLASGVPRKEIARRKRVSESLIYQIEKGKIWKHVL